VLTAADIRAVGPAAWNAWKGALLRQLYNLAAEVMSGGHAAEAKRHRVAAAQEGAEPAAALDEITFLPVIPEARKIILVGDALNYKLGRLGAPPRLFTPDMAQAHASVHKIAALDFEVCCFGHGPPLTENAGQQVRAFANSLA
jgi:hypothetical protein